MKPQLSKQNIRGLTKIKWKYIIPILLIIIALMAYVIGQSFIKKSSQNAVKIQEQRVSQGDIKIDIVADGQVNLPVKYLDFQVQGRIKNVNVKPGQVVKKGDILAELESDDYVQSVQKAEAAYTKANLSLKDAQPSAQLQTLSEKQKLDELKQTYDDSANQATLQVASEQEKLQQLEAQYKNAENVYMPMTKVPDAYSKSEIDKAKSDYANAKTAYENEVTKYNIVKKQAADSITNAKQSYEMQKQRYANILTNGSNSVETAKLNLDDAKNALDLSKQTLSKTVLVAPSDGKIMYISKQAGDTVSTSSSNSDSATADTSHFIVFKDSNKVQINASVAEEDIKNLYFGQNVEVDIDAIDEGTLTGKIIGIESLPKIDSNGVATYQVTSELDQENEQIMQGMSGTISFIISQKKNVLTIPNKAVTVDDGVQYVEIKDQSGNISKRQVQTGLSDGENAEVVSGLKQGETVVIGGTK